MLHLEKDIEKSPRPIDIEGSKIILFQMKNCICKILKEDGSHGTGFFCKIPFDESILYLLITNNHILNEYDIEDDKNIEIAINDNKICINLKLDKWRKRFTDSFLDVTFIEINPENDNIKYFLDIDENININLNNYFSKKSIYILHYPKGDKVKVSYGLSQKILNNNIQHYCCTEKGSSGSPILLLETFKVIGVHIGAPLHSFEYNTGNFIKSAISIFKNKEKDKLRNKLSISQTKYENKNIFINENLEFNSKSSFKKFGQTKKEKENNYINKKNTHIKFSNLKKLSQDIVINILVFLDDNDLINIFKINDKFKLFFNMSICNAYYFEIKYQLNKYKSDLEVLKYSLIYSKVKERLKIDFSINIRFINHENDNEPKYFQLIYFYNYYKSNSRKENKIMDYYLYDLYPKKYETSKIYIDKSISSINGNNNKVVFIQPILPFKINDKGIINLEIFSINNFFIDPNSIKLVLKKCNLKNYLSNFSIRKNDLRICQYEYSCRHWKLFNKNNFKLNELIKKIKNYFQKNFMIKEMTYNDNTTFLIVKLNLVANSHGIFEFNNIDNISETHIIIRNKDEIIQNEINKNNIPFEKRQILEIRVGDSLTVYLSLENKILNNF